MSRKVDRGLYATQLGQYTPAMPCTRRHAAAVGCLCRLPRNAVSRREDETATEVGGRGTSHEQRCLDDHDA